MTQQSEASIQPMSHMIMCCRNPSQTPTSPAAIRCLLHQMTAFTTECKPVSCICVPCGTPFVPLGVLTLAPDAAAAEQQSVSRTESCV